MTARRFEIFVIIVIIAVIGIVYAFKENATFNPKTVSQDTNTQQNTGGEGQNNSAADALPQVPSTVITYQGVDGKNALEILKATHKVELKSYSFGDMVISIDGIAPNPSTHFWSMYVNGEMSQVGASQYQTKSTDTIKWQLDEIK